MSEAQYGFIIVPAVFLAVCGTLNKVITFLGGFWWPLATQATDQLSTVQWNFGLSSVQQLHPGHVMKSAQAIDSTQVELN